MRLGDVVAGAVMKHSSQWNLARESLLDSGLSPETPGLDVQRACGTSLEAAILIGNKIALGQIDAGIAGGVDTVSDPPIVFGREYQQLMLRSFRAKSFGARIAPFLGLRPRHFKPSLPGVGEPRTGPVDGPAHGADGAHLADPARGRRTRSRSRATSTRAAPGPRGSWRTSSCPTSGSRPTTTCARDTSLEKLAKLKPSFADGRHADRRQLDADDGRRGRRAARERGLGALARAAGAGIPDLRQGGGGRLRRRRRAC